MMRELYDIQRLQYPEDKGSIAMLTLAEKNFWYSAQDPQKMTVVGNTRDFNTFWKIYYMWPLKVKRFLYLFKFW